MKEFFGIGGHTRTPEGAWSWQHILFVSLMLVAMVALAVLLGIQNRDKDAKTKNKALIWAALLIDGFEIMKIVVNCIDDGFGAMRRMLPLFLCSIQLITIPLAAFTKGRLKEASLDFVMTFGILGAVFGTVGATQNYNAYPVLSMTNVVSAITHCISGFASLYIMFSRMDSINKKNIPVTLSILSGFCIAALIANIALDYNYMFLMNHDGTPYVIFWNMVGGNRVLYAICVVLIFFIYIVAFYHIHAWLKAKKAAKPIAEASRLQPAIAVADAEDSEQKDNE